MATTRQMFLALGLAAASAVPVLLATSVAVPAAAQVSVSIGFDNFRSRLAPYGTWSNHPRWGEVWHPTRVERDFRPYYNGHWANTREYGWLWVSDESWGDVPYHYGRWVFDPREGWLWVPGYVWAPSWVVWRSGGGNIGWFPMPPGDDYYGDGAYRDNFDNQYGYRDWYGSSFGNDQFLSLWIFVGQDHFGDRDFRNYAVPQRDYGRFISQTRNTTNYITINNYVVNRSIDDTRLPRATSQRFQPVPASNVIGRNALVTKADLGRQVEQRERKQRPIPVNINPAEQRGRASPNSNVQQQIPNQTPQGVQERGNDRNPAAKGPAQAKPQAERAAPVAKTPQPKDNQAPQGAQERGNDRNPAAKSPAQANPQTERAAPVAKAPQPKENPAPQGAQERGGNRNQGANDAAQTKPQAERGATATPAAPVASTPPQRGKAAVQENRTAPRVQGNAPAANAQDNARNNQARGDSQGDTKSADRKAADDKVAADKKAADEKKAAANRGQN